MGTSRGGAPAESHRLRRKSRLRPLAAGLLVALASTAAAHPEFNPTRSNRYLKLTLVGGGAARIAYTVMIGEVPAAATRRAADVNGDGQVDEAEARGWAARMQRAVDEGLTVEVDGIRVHPTWDTPVVGGFVDRRVGPIPFSVDLVGRVPTGRGTHTLRLDDATPLDDVGDTEIRFEEAPGTRLDAGWRGRDDGGKQTRFVFSVPKFSVIEDRSVGLRFTDDSARRGRAPLPIAMGGLLVGVAIALWRVRRARAKARATGAR